MARTDLSRLFFNMHLGNSRRAQGSDDKMTDGNGIELSSADFAAGAIADVVVNQVPFPVIVLAHSVSGTAADFFYALQGSILLNDLLLDHYGVDETDETD